MKSYTKLVSVIGIGLLLSSSSLIGSETSPKEILDKAYRYLGGLDQYAFKATVIDKESKDTVKIKHQMNAKVDRPDKLMIEIRGDIRNRTDYINNGKFTMYDHDYNYYGVLDTGGKTIDEVLDYIFSRYAIRAPLTQLVYSDMDKRIKFSKSKFFGTKEINGVMCDYVAFASSQRELHLWITQGEHPLIKAYTLIEKSLPGQPTIHTSITWDTNVHIPEDTFTFKVPKDATQISVTSPN